MAFAPRFQSQPFITVAVSDAQLAELRDVLDPKQVRQALFAAVTRTTRTGRTQITRRVTGDTNLQKKYVDRVVTAHVPRKGGGDPVGTIRISHSQIPLIAYRPRVTKRGVTVQFRKNMRPIHLKHAFKVTARSASQIAKGLGGHLGIFLRAKGRAHARQYKATWKGYRGKKARTVKGGLTAKGIAWGLPIEEQLGPSVLTIFGRTGTEQMAREELGKLHHVLQKNLDSQVNRFLGRRKGAAAVILPA